jgi:2-polyprenyl-3-methyl-5-hydroxy-6-metoxy-1,4-benzoquinol methylase
METGECPICLNKGVKYVNKHLDFYNSGVYYCPICIHWFCFPEPDENWLKDYYENVYSLKRNTFFGRPYFILMERRARAQGLFIKMHADPLRFNHFEGWKILELGCGIGALVHYFQTRKADVIGIDGDEKAVEIGRKRWNVNVCNTFIESGKIEEKYDLVCLSHFVEHLVNIEKTLEKILSYIKTGGFMFVEVPNCFSEMFEKPVPMDSHIHFFSKKSLLRLFDKFDVEMIRCVSAGPNRYKAYGFSYKRNAMDRVWNQGIKIFRKMQHFGKRLPVIRNTGFTVKTDYDCNFSRYYSSDRPYGMWLRALVKKK